MTEKKKIAFISTNGYEDLELHYPFIRLKEAGYESVLIGLEEGTIVGKNGYPAQVDLAIEEANPDDYIGVVVPGGLANPDYLRRNQLMLDFVAKMNDDGKLIAAICHAGWVLISAKILDGQKGTCYFAIKDDMINAGLNYVDEPVVVDGNLITSRHPGDLPDFMKAILSYLEAA